MRFQGITRAAAAALALLLSLSAGACGSKDATGPAIGLSLEEVYQLADELGAELRLFLAGRRKGGGEAGERDGAGSHSRVAEEFSPTHPPRMLRHATFLLSGRIPRLVRW